MTTHDPYARTSGRAVKSFALATLLLTAGVQLLVAACAEEANKLAPAPPAEYGLGPYLETTPYLSSGVPNGPNGDRDALAITTKPGPRPDESRNDLPRRPASPEEPSLSARGP